MKKVQFKQLPSLLDYMYLLENNTSTVTTGSGKGTDQTNTKVGEPDIIDGFWAVFLSNKQMKLLDTPSRNDFQNKYNETVPIRKGVLMQTPIKATSYLPVMQNESLLALTVATMAQYVNATSDGTYLQNYMFSFMPLSHFFPYESGLGQHGSSSQLQGREFLQSFVKLEVTNPSPPPATNLVDIPLSRIEFYTGGVFAIVAPSPLGTTETFNVNGKAITFTWPVGVHTRLICGYIIDPTRAPIIDRLVDQNNLRCRTMADPANPNDKVSQNDAFFLNTYEQLLLPADAITEATVHPFFLVACDSNTGTPPVGFSLLDASSVPQLAVTPFYPLGGDNLGSSTALPISELLLTYFWYRSALFNSFYTDPISGELTTTNFYAVQNPSTYDTFVGEFKTALMAAMKTQAKTVTIKSTAGSVLTTRSVLPLCNYFGTHLDNEYTTYNVNRWRFDPFALIQTHGMASVSLNDGAKITYNLPTDHTSFSIFLQQYRIGILNLKMPSAIVKRGIAFGPESAIGTTVSTTTVVSSKDIVEPRAVNPPALEFTSAAFDNYYSKVKTQYKTSPENPT